MNTTKTIAALFDFDGVIMDTETQYTVFLERTRTETSERRRFRTPYQRTDSDTDLREVLPDSP